MATACKFNYVFSSSLLDNHDGRVVKALDLRSNGRMSAWVQTPLVVKFFTAMVR